jgi:dienelactone hydrolase
VLVFPEAFGLGENALRHAKQLAEAGYVALACDLHGDGRFIDDLPEALALVQPLFDDPKRTRARPQPWKRLRAARKSTLHEWRRSASASTCRLSLRVRVPT